MLDVPKDVPEPTVTASNQPSAETAPDGSSTAQRIASIRPVSSVTQPPVQVDASVLPGSSDSSGIQTKEGALDRRPFFAPGSAALGGGPKVPDFRGMTLRAVLEESSAKGFAVEVDGSGLARTQVPPPGAELPPNARIRVQFAR
jgi:hypothetical protein